MSCRAHRPLDCTAPPPRKRYGATARQVGTLAQYFVFFGSSQLALIRQLVLVYEHDLSSTGPGTWRQVSPSGTAPAAREGACCAFFPATATTSDLSVCFGGLTDEGDSNEILIFDHATEGWTIVNGTAAEAPTRRQRALCSREGADKLYVIFGYSTTASSPANDNKLYVFNTVTRLWGTPVAQPAKMATRSDGFMCHAFAGSTHEGVYLFGGHGIRAPLNDVWKMGPSQATFQLSSPNVLRPPARAFHSAVRYGTTMYILLGHDHEKLFNDMWKVNLSLIQRPWVTGSELTWERVSYSIHTHDASGSVAPSPRHSAAAVRHGANIFVYGGYLDLGATELSNELWGFNMVSGYWTMLHASTAARAGHQGFLVPTEERVSLLFMGGIDATDSVVFHSVGSTDFHAVGSLPAELSYFSLTQEPNGDHLLFGGLGDEVSNKMYSMSLLTTTQTSVNGTSSVNVTFTVAELASDPTLTASGTRSIRRWGHVAATIGNHTIFCGGAITPVAGPGDGDACYAYNRATGKYQLFPATYGTQLSQMPYPSVGASMIAFEDKLFVFGGQLTSPTTVREHSVDALRFDTFLSQCRKSPLTGISDSNCMHCAEGSLDPDIAEALQRNRTWDAPCVSVEVGEVAQKSYVPQESCEAGYSSPIVGGVSRDVDCQFCPSGTYRSNDTVLCTACGNDSYCPIGSERLTSNADRVFSSSHPQSINSTVVTTLDTSSSVEVPVAVYILTAGVYGLFIVTLIVIILFKRTADALREHYYFDDRTMIRLHKIFDPSAVPGYGLDTACLYNALSHPALAVRDLTLDYINELFRNTDADGSGYLDFDEFLEILMDLMEEGRMPPLKLSPATECSQRGVALTSDSQNCCTEWLRGINFNSLDFYRDSHRMGQNGDPLRLMQNTTGGIFSMLFYGGALMLVVLLFVMFYYHNFSETMNFLPSQWAPKELTGDFRVSASLVMDYTFTSASCVEEGDTCVHAVLARLAPSTAAYAVIHGGNSTSCEWTDHPTNPVCTVTWYCKNCSMTFGHELQLDMQFGGSGQKLVVTVNVSTGVKVPELSKGIVYFSDVMWSAVTVPLVPPPGRDLRGTPASHLKVVLTKVSYESTTGPFSSDETGSGHVAAISTDSRGAGGSVDADDYFIHENVPVAVTFTVLTDVLRLQRTLTQSLIQFVSSLLGAISGIGALFVFMINKIDQSQENLRAEIHKKALEAAEDKMQEKWAEPVTEEVLKRERRDREMIKGLLKVRVNFGVAMEELKLMREVCKDIVSNTSVSDFLRASATSTVTALRQESTAI